MGQEPRRWIRFRRGGGSSHIGGYKKGDEVYLPDHMACMQVSHGHAVFIAGPTNDGGTIPVVWPQVGMCTAKDCTAMCVWGEDEKFCHYHKAQTDKEPDAPPDKRKHRKRKRSADHGSGSPGVGRPRGGSDDDGPRP